MWELNFNATVKGCIVAYEKRANLIVFYEFQGWPGGAMVLSKLPVPGRPTIWMTVGQGPIMLAIGAGGGCLDILLSSILSLLFLPFSGGRPDFD